MTTKRREIHYKGFSADEIGLVKGAKASGIQLIKRTTSEVVIFNMYDQKKETFQVLAIFPFSSDRKRMSIILKDEYGMISLYTKGADHHMLDRLNLQKNGIPDM